MSEVYLLQCLLRVLSIGSRKMQKINVKVCQIPVITPSACQHCGVAEGRSNEKSFIN